MVEGSKLNVFSWTHLGFNPNSLKFTPEEEPTDLDLYSLRYGRQKCMQVSAQTQKMNFLKWRFWATKSFKYSFAFANDLNHCLFRDKTSVFQACNLPKWTKFPDFIRGRKPQFLKFPPYFFVFMMKVHRFTPSYGCFSHPRC